MMISKKIKSPITLFIISLLLVSCGSMVSQKQTNKMSSSENSKNIKKAQNDFAFNLFNLINQSDKRRTNKLISPLSIYMDLSMLYNGASGETQKAMKKTLELHGLNINILNKSQSKILESLPKLDTAVQINMANAIWYRKGLKPKFSFLTLNEEYYHAKIQEADFGNPETKSVINNWVKDKTQNKIPSIIDQIKPADLMFLLNAVYFKGEWAEGFDSKYTQDNTFYLSGKEEKQVPFMFKKDRLNYADVSGMKIAELPYGNGHFNMFVILPPEDENVGDLIKSLNPERFSELIAQMKSTNIKLYLPKWETAYTADNLKDELSQMGMGIAFENRADFSKLFQKESAKISQVKHKTYIKVNEQGTEAAAATSTGMMTTSVKVKKDPEMKINRPFVYLITENDSGAILFLGTVNDPTIE